MQDRAEPFRDAAPVAAVLRGVSWAGEAGGALSGRLSDVRLILHDGEHVALLGARGSGRHALLHLLNGQLRGWNGTAIVLAQPLPKTGQAPRRHRRRVAYLPAQPALDPQRSVWENVMLGRLGHQSVLASVLGRSSARDRARVAQCIGALQLKPLANRRAGSLDADAQRRIALARALAQEPRLLLAEAPPRGSADPRRAEADQIALLCQLARQRRIPLVFTCHHADLAMRRADRVVLMRAGGIAFSSPVETLSVQQRGSLVRLGAGEGMAAGASGLRLVV
ncbi:MAG: ATP-binding cassette domain-containing protein [Pseudomonadota bacterium]